MKHRHMVEEKQVTTHMSPHAFKSCPFRIAKVAPGTFQISHTLGSDHPISRRAGRRGRASPINFAIDGNGANRRDRRLHSNLIGVEQPTSVRDHPSSPAINALPATRPIANRFNQPCERFDALPRSRPKQSGQVVVMTDWRMLESGNRFAPRIP